VLQVHARALIERAGLPSENARRKSRSFRPGDRGSAGGSGVIVNSNSASPSRNVTTTERERGFEITDLIAAIAESRSGGADTEGVGVRGGRQRSPATVRLEEIDPLPILFGRQTPLQDLPLRSFATTFGLVDGGRTVPSRATPHGTRGSRNRVPRTSFRPPVRRSQFGCCPAPECRSTTLRSFASRRAREPAEGSLTIPPRSRGRS